MSAAVQQEPLDQYRLTKELDRAKSLVFRGKNAAFLGSLQCSLNFYWTVDIKTAATDGVNLMWNPYWFLKLPPATRGTVLLHELWHPGRLHMQRMGNRNPKVWNWACDIRINNDLTAEGHSFEGVEWCWRDPSFPPGTPEEDIYDALIKNCMVPTGGAWSLHAPDGSPQEPDPNNDPDMPELPGDDGTDMLQNRKLSKEDQARAVNNVVRAMQQAKLANQAGNIPGDVEVILNQFLAPIVPWEQLLHRFMSDLTEDGYSWKRPNRRFLGNSNLYLPACVEDEGKLDHLIYYEDVSGSISDTDALRFNSEFKYVKETFQPHKMTLVQFDTRITQEVTYKQEDPFDQVKIIGRGGTSLVPVREHLLEHRPTAAVVFSDLQCDPMESLPFEIPIIWVCINNRTATVPFGKLIHIR